MRESERGVDVRTCGVESMTASPIVLSQGRLLEPKAYRGLPVHQWPSRRPSSGLLSGTGISSCEWLRQIRAPFSALRMVPKPEVEQHYWPVLLLFLGPLWISSEKGPSEKAWLGYTGPSLCCGSAGPGALTLALCQPWNCSTKAIHLSYCICQMASIPPHELFCKLHLSVCAITSLFREEWFVYSWGFLRLSRKSD